MTRALFFLIISLCIGWLFYPTKAQALTKVPILMYHYIGNNPNPADLARNALSTSPDKFDSQMAYLAQNGYTPISLDTLFSIFQTPASAPTKPIVLTFDDGYIDFFYNAFPILSKYGFHAVSFISTGLVGGSYYMNWNQIKQIQSSGLITFEDHTIHHVNLLALSSSKLLQELSVSKKIIESETGYPVNFVAYPYGASGQGVWAAAQKSGFLGGLGTWSSKAGSIGINMPRIRISGQLSLAAFAGKL